MANHYVGCITEDLAKHIQILPLSDEEKARYLYPISHWGDLYDAPPIQLPPAEGDIPETADMLPLFLELASLAEESGDVSLKGVLYHAVTVELYDDLEGNYDPKWAPSIDELKALLFRDEVMERAYVEFAGYEDALLEYDEEYREQAPALCGWTEYFGDWYGSRCRVKKPDQGVAPTDPDRLQSWMESWMRYVEAYPFDSHGARFFTGQLVRLIGQLNPLEQAGILEKAFMALAKVREAHAEDPRIQHHFMAAMVAPGKRYEMPCAFLTAQHGRLKRIADESPDNPDVHAEYANFLYLLAKSACAEQQWDKKSDAVGELGEILLRFPGHKEITNWYARMWDLPLGPRPEHEAEPQPEPVHIPKKVLKQVVAELREKTVQPAVTLRLGKGNPTATGSKVGGAPYLPPDFDHPTRDGKPLWLLAQLNLEELPHLPGFPETGMLQFYIASGDHYGADFDNPTGQTGFRVVYHPTIERDSSRLLAPPSMDPEGAMLPFTGEFVLKAKLTEMPMSAHDFRFDATFLDLLRKHIPTEAERVFDLGMELSEELEERFPGEGHRMGGYPYFVQEDPRLYNKRYRDYTVLLLQLDSEQLPGAGFGEYGICWGDAGVASFYITPEQLAARDFSRVLYTWDCG